MSHLQLFDGRQEGLMGGSHLGPELGTDAFGEATGTQSPYQCANVLGTPLLVEPLAFERGAL